MLGTARHRRLRTPVAFLVFLGVCGVGAALSMAGCGDEAEAAADAPYREADPDEPAVQYDPTKSLAPMLEAVGPAVVSIYAEGVSIPGLGGSAPQGTGSGFVIDEDGLVVTNHHVIDGARGVEVRLPDGRRFSATVLGSDPATDLALLRLADAEDLPTVVLGRSDELRVGDWVVAVGNPMGLEHSATVGIVSGKGRGSLGLYADSYIDFLQTDADIAPGSSGGPLFDLQGRVVGIATAVGAGLRPGFAIPVDQAKRVVRQLRDHGEVERGWLGAASVPGDTHGEGARIGKVFADTPAERAGLRPGDVVTTIDGERIHSFNELRGRIATTEPDTELVLGVQRDGETLDVEVTLARRPDGDALASLSEAEARSGPSARPKAERPRNPFERFFAPPREKSADDEGPRLGIGVRGTPEGVRVVRVDEGTVAERLGLRPGDVLREVNDAEIRDPADVRDALGKDRRRVSIAFDREGKRREASYEFS